MRTFCGRRRPHPIQCLNNIIGNRVTEYRRNLKEIAELVGAWKGNGCRNEIAGQLCGGSDNCIRGGSGSEFQGNHPNRWDTADGASKGVNIRDDDRSS